MFGDGPKLGPLLAVEEAEGGLGIGERGVVTEFSVPLRVEIPGLAFEGDPQPRRGSEIAKSRDALLQGRGPGKPALLRPVLRHGLLGNRRPEIVEEPQGQGGALRHHDAVAPEDTARTSRIRGCVTRGHDG
ncbi:hypothetical protein mvi_55350 [Methylobacterium indicum]|uniref:Uncharacterized protein n=1 Tax=Methylobacterium indicum TaxID=1775910 RepID=A0A8H8WZ27_9HYPH|nr:hypothetical protein mvi_55350 [Methylobacterium indicum]